MVTRARDPGPFGREIEHTADLGLEVEAPTLAVLFERAGLAMLGLVLDLGAVDARERIVLACEAEDRETLLHDWLHALLIQLQVDGLALSEIGVEVASASVVRGWGAGERLDPSRHRVYTEIKGVSYHELAVRETPTGWWARFILDV